MNKCSAILSVTFTIVSFTPEGHPASDWEDLWTRLYGCLAAYTMASLVITFEPQPAEWDTLTTEMEANFLGLKKLGREVILDAATSDYKRGLNAAHGMRR